MNKISWRELGGKKGSSLNSVERYASLKFNKLMTYVKSDRYYAYFK